MPSVTTTYTITCTRKSDGDVAAKSIKIIVNPPAGPVTININSSQPVAAGVPVRLACTGGTGTGYTWSSTGGSVVSPGSGSGAVYDPTYSQQGTYTVTCTDSAGDTTHASVTVAPDCSITATPSTIVPPETSQLAWSCPAGTAIVCSITDSSGTQIVTDGPTNGTTDVSPTDQDTYTLSCTANNGLDSTIPPKTTTVNAGGPGICETNPNAPGCP
ncbi:MAG TPA: hypothetical protein VHZ04_02515 [Candidatus Paceibacterota bacterium]|nr:hypothetical protein [Candidatus Paceibacterota bacterium]